MRRDQLEHLIRASAAILREDGVIVIGSQAILGTYDEGRLPAVVTRSVEADLLPLDGDERKADLIDGSIGEDSPFHAAFGVYGQGAGPRTATLPPGWRERLVPLTGDGTRGATGWCLEPHDLVVAKLVAWRQKDRRYVRALLDAGLVDATVLVDRLIETEIDVYARGRALSFLADRTSRPGT